MKFEHGSKAKDKVTGFVGVVVGHADYITGCDQYLVQPECSVGGKKPEALWFDKNRLNKISGEVIKIEAGDKPGACDPAPIK